MITICILLVMAVTSFSRTDREKLFVYVVVGEERCMINTKACQEKQRESSLWNNQIVTMF